MKRTGRLFDRILDRENLRRAFYLARRGKRGDPEVEEFAADLDMNLRRIAFQLETGCLLVCRYRQFAIRDPKPRIITAPCFRERVVHHAIMNVCEPHFERFLIADSFACRRGKGRIAALQRAVRFSSRHPLAVKLDMRKYFASISHHILMKKLRRRFKDFRLLALFQQIVHSHGGEDSRGLPIGSLTSQHFANFYLGWFDRYVKQQLSVRGYVRYMDDCVLWCDDKQTLDAWSRQCVSFLGTELDLETKTQSISRVRHGFEFLGCRVYPDHLKLNGRSRRRFRQKMRDLDGEVNDGAISSDQLQQRVTSLVAFTRAGGVKAWKFRQSVLQKMPVSSYWARTG